jgi:hypothetical protein
MASEPGAVLGESGVGWLAYALHRMDFEFEDRFRDLMKLTPSEYWRRQCKCTFQFDPISTKLIDDIGVETMMWGSDYPHRWRLARKLEIHRGAIRRPVARGGPQDRLRKRRQILQPDQLTQTATPGQPPGAGPGISIRAPRGAPLLLQQSGLLLIEQRRELGQYFVDDRGGHTFELLPAACVEIESARLIAANDTRGPCARVGKRHSEAAGTGEIAAGRDRHHDRHHRHPIKGARRYDKHRPSALLLMT